MPSSDVEYYRQRASTERELAKDAQRADVAAIHEELARQYEALVNRAELRPTLRVAFGKISQTPGVESRRADAGSSAMSVF